MALDLSAHWQGFGAGKGVQWGQRRGASKQLQGAAHTAVWLFFLARLQLQPGDRACAGSPGQTVSRTGPRTRRGACPPQLTADPTSHSHLIGDETQGARGKDFPEVTYPLSGRRGPVPWALQTAAGPFISSAPKT